MKPVLFKPNAKKLTKPQSFLKSKECGTLKTPLPAGLWAQSDGFDVATDLVG